MSTTLYEIKVPPNTIDDGVSFEKQLGRLCTLMYTYDTDEGHQIPEQMSFDGVEAFKCTYYTANSKEVFEAYRQVIDLGKTDWLKTISENLIRNGELADGLRHLRVFFDDGPCYEFICQLFEVVVRTEA